MSVEKAQNIQDTFLNALRKSKVPVSMYLTNGVKLQGAVVSFDNFSVMLRRDRIPQLVYKHAISTIIPGAPIKMFDDGSDDDAAMPAAADA